MQPKLPPGDPCLDSSGALFAYNPCSPAPITSPKRLGRTSDLATTSLKRCSYWIPYRVCTPIRAFASAGPPSGTGTPHAQHVAQDLKRGEWRLRCRMEVN